MRRFFLVAMTVVTSGCGGQSEKSCSDCPPPRTRLSSAEATVAIRSELPEGAVLLQIGANPAGLLDHEGFDTRWVAVIQTTSGEKAWLAGVGMVDGEPFVTFSEKPPFECAGPPLHEVDSAIVVPESLSRINALQNLRAVEDVLVNYWQEAPCFAQMSGDAPTGHAVYVTRRGSDWQEFFFAHFDDSAKLVSLCGPCESGLLDNCETCSP